MLGFLWGKIEADTTMKPLAETALQRKDFTSRAESAAATHDENR